MHGNISAPSCTFPACFVFSSMIGALFVDSSLKLLMFTHKQTLHQRSLFDVLPRDLNGEDFEGGWWWEEPKLCGFRVNSKAPHGLTRSEKKHREMPACQIHRKTCRESGMQHLHHDPNLCPLCTLPYITCKARRIDVCGVEVKLRTTVTCCFSAVPHNDNTASDF